MAKLVVLSVLLVLYILKVGNGYYYHWYTTDRMKTKLLLMSRELIADAIRNIQRVDHFKEYYTISEAYDIGQMLYFIRSKFARMVRVYILSYENKDSLSTFHLHLPSLKEIHHLGLEIYHLIEMLEEHVAGADDRPDFSMYAPKRKVKATTNNTTPTDTKKKTTPPNKRYLRERPIDFPSFPKQGLYGRQPNGALRKRMKFNRGRDFAGTFDSDVD